MKIVVLEGGTSPERSVSLRSSAAVKKALEELGLSYASFDTAGSWSELDKIIEHDDIVLPILHGEGGEDGTIQEKLESLGVKYLGSGPEASKICFDKVLTHQALEAAGIKMPSFAVADSTALDHIYDLFHKGFVTKPINGGSSVDTLIVRGKPDQQAKEECLRLCAAHGTMLFEELIVGQEITCAVIGNEALPVILIRPPENEEFDFENKYNGRSEEICPVPEELLSSDVQAKAREIAIRVHTTLNARHLSRIDIMIDEDGELYVLELNTIPGLTESSLLPKAASAVGLSMKEVVNRFISLAKED